MIKKSAIVSVLIFSIFIFTGCEKRLFHFVLDFDQTSVYEIDQVGSFEVGRVISKQDVLQALDIPESATITGVDIESISLVVKVKDENQAQSVIVTAQIKDLNTQKEKIFENYSIPLTGFLGLSNPFSPASLLIDKGVSLLKKKLNGYVNNFDNLDMELILDGQSQPNGTRMALQIYFKIKATVKYDDCMEVPGFLNSGDKCDIEE